MAKKRITISSVLGGRSPMYHVSKPGQFLHSIAIDTEKNVSAFVRPSGNLSPTRYTKQSGSNLNSAPIWILTNPKNQKAYIYAANGRFISYDIIWTEALVGTPTAGAGNGATYYNDYYYLATATDIARYGPLSGVPTLALSTYWTVTLSKTALTNTTYPGTRNVNYPNHVLFVHPSDNKLYIADYVNGQGLIHSLTTAYDGSGGAGAYAAAGVAGTLMLPFGMMPMAMGVGANGTDLAILCTPEGGWSGGAIFKPGNAALFLWDRSSVSFYRQVNLRDSLGTALLNKNGQLFVWTGNIDRGATLSRYLGGYSCQALAITAEGSPPYAGAVDSMEDQIIWGGAESTPSSVAGIYAYGFRAPSLPSTSLNHIARISDTSGTLPIVSALKSIVPGVIENSTVIGWRTDTPAAYGLDSIGGSAAFSAVWRSDVFNIGQNFHIDRIKLPLNLAVAANMSIVPKLVFDDYASTVTLKTINNTNFPNGELLIDPLITGSDKTTGKNNFFLELGFAGTVELDIVLPIIIDLTTLND